MSERQGLARSVTRLENDVVELEKLLQSADRNQTVLQSELRLSRARSEERDRELREAEDRIERLTADMRNVATPRLQSLRKRSLLMRILETMLPQEWTGHLKTGIGHADHSPSNTTSSETGSEDLDDALVAALRRNITALSTLLEGKDMIIEEMRASMQHRQTEDEDRFVLLMIENRKPRIVKIEVFCCCCRRGAYAALKEGVDQLAADRDRQAAVAAVR